MKKLFVNNIFVIKLFGGRVNTYTLHLRYCVKLWLHPSKQITRFALWSYWPWFRSVGVISSRLILTLYSSILIKWNTARIYDRVIEDSIHNPIIVIYTWLYLPWYNLLQSKIKQHHAIQKNANWRVLKTLNFTKLKLRTNGFTRFFSTLRHLFCTPVSYQTLTH